MQRKMSLRDFKLEPGGDKEAWTDTQAAKDLLAKLRSSELERQMVQNQYARIEKAEKVSQVRQVYMKLFTTSRISLGILDTGAEPRSSSVQSNFRAAVIYAQDSSNPNTEHPNEICCPVTHLYFHEEHTVAGHLFAWQHGQDVMDEVFGRSSESELLSPFNGILWSEDAEMRSEKGLLVIVPDVPDDADLEARAPFQCPQQRAGKATVGYSGSIYEARYATCVR